MKGNLEVLLAEIRRGTAPSVLLLYGDDFRVQSATKALVDELVPSENRAFNLESFNGPSAPWDQIEAALLTPPFFPGTKVILIENAPYFLSSEHKGDLAEKIFQYWSEGRKEEAARLLAQFLRLEGWTQTRWEGLQGSFSATELADLFGDLSRESRQDLDEILAFCRGRTVAFGAASEGEQGRLAEFLERGLPSGVVLLLTASHVDRRTRFYKRFEEKAVVLDLSLERDRTGRVSREIVAEWLDRRLKEADKKIDSQARDILLARAGDELWAIHQELEKLLLYVGEDARIKSKDVEEVFLDRAEGWIFDLTGAIAERDAVRAIGHLERLLSQGEHPLRLLGTIASEVRRLLVARQLIDGELRHQWRKQMSYPQFQASLPQQGVPVLGRSVYGDYMTFTKADNFTSRELLGFLESIYQTDIRLKSTGRPPRILMERLILEMCQQE